MDRPFDAIVIGGGVIGASTAFHLGKLGCPRVLLLEKGAICSGATAKSCAIVRTHYSIPTNTEMAVRSLEYFNHFPEMLEDAEADCGFVNTGYLIFAGEGEHAEAVRRNIAMQSGVGANCFEISVDEARERHPLLQLDDAVIAAYEPDSGFAEPYLTTTSFIAAARRRGVEVITDCPVTGLIMEAHRVRGVRTAKGDFHTGCLISAVGSWSRNIAAWAGVEIPLEVTRHIVLTFRREEPYGLNLPVVKDLTTENKMYFRPSTGGTVLVGTGDEGDPLADPDELSEHIPPSFVDVQGAQVMHRMPVFETGGLAHSWVGPYDITPDWNPVLGSVPGVEGLLMAFGFSGHGFKLSPMVGKVLAQTALGIEPDLDISPYRVTRYAEGEPLTGAYGAGSLS